MLQENDKTRKQRLSYFKAEALSRKTHFSIDEVRSLQVMYSEIIAVGKLDRMRFREVMFSTFDITEDVMLDRMFRVFDANNDTVVDETEWVMGLSTLLRGTLDEYTAFCYYIYDINGDRTLGRDELFFCLKNCLIRTAGMEEDVEESIKDIVEIAMKKLDTDKNGKICFGDYELAVRADPLLLEACGPCLPPTSAVHDFLSTFTQTYRPVKISLRLLLASKTGGSARPGPGAAGGEQSGKIRQGGNSAQSRVHPNHTQNSGEGNPLNSRKGSPARKTPDRKSPSKN